MTNCDKFMSLCTDYLDGIISEDQKPAFERHLKECPNCASTLNRTKALRRRLQGLTPVKTSDAFHIILRSRIRREIENPTFRERIISTFQTYRLPVYATASAALLLVSFLSFSPFFQNNNMTSNSDSPILSSQSVDRSMVITKENDQVEEHIYFMMDEIPEEDFFKGVQSIDSKTLQNYRKIQQTKYDTSQVDSSPLKVFPATVTF